MKREPANFLNRALRPAYVLLATCVILFVSATSQLSRLEHEAAPLIAQLKGAAIPGYGIASFAREYLADPFGKAMGMPESQLQLCRRLSVFVPAHQAAQAWRNNALLGATLALLALAYQRWGSKASRIVEEFKTKLNLKARQLILQRLMAAVSGRMPKMQQKGRPMKEATVNAIVSCPACRQELRVPIGKGRIRIKCPKCGNQFETTV